MVWICLLCRSGQSSWPYLGRNACNAGFVLSNCRCCMCVFLLAQEENRTEVEKTRGGREGGRETDSWNLVLGRNYQAALLQYSQGRWPNALSVSRFCLFLSVSASLFVFLFLSLSLSLSLSLPPPFALHRTFLICLRDFISFPPLCFSSVSLSLSFSLTPSCCRSLFLSVYSPLSVL